MPRTLGPQFTLEDNGDLLLTLTAGGPGGPYSVKLILAKNIANGKTVDLTALTDVVTKALTRAAFRQRMGQS